MLTGKVYSNTYLFFVYQVVYSCIELFSCLKYELILKNKFKGFCVYDIVDYP